MTTTTHLELSDVGDRLGVDNRVLRYIVEQQIVGGLLKINQGRGTRRRLTKHQAVLVGLAAIFHNYGMRGPILKILVAKARTAVSDKQRDITVTLTTNNVSTAITVNAATIYSRLDYC